MPENRHANAHYSTTNLKLSIFFQMFDNIASLEFTKNEQDIPIAMGMISSEGEKMKFRRPVECSGRIEDWMTKVENEMRQTNRLITKEAIYRYRESAVR